MVDKTAEKITPLVLASSSPRRSEILGMLGIEHIVFRPEIGEDNSLSKPGPLVRRLSRRKAEEAERAIGGRLILSADTVVIFEGRIMGKPASAEDALEMLRRLSGQWHRVHTGVTLIIPGEGRSITDEEVTAVKFSDLLPGEIRDYISTGEPFDKAGGYGIQGRGSALVERIEGCYYNVVGLPVAKVISMLREAGYRYGFPGLYRCD